MKDDFPNDFTTSPADFASKFEVSPPRAPFMISQIILGFSISALLIENTFASQADFSLWDNRPATDWHAAFPIGNGHMGALIFGGTESQTIRLNDDQFYSHEPDTLDSAPASYLKSYPEAAKLASNGRFAEAGALMQKYGQGKLGAVYQPIGDLKLTFPKLSGEAAEYQRKLDITTATHTETFTKGDCHVEILTFASHPKDVIIMKILTSTKQDLRFNFNSPHPNVHTVAHQQTMCWSGQGPGFVYRRPVKDGKINPVSNPLLHTEICDATGTLKFPDKKEQILYGNEIGGRGMFFETRVAVISSNGKVSQSNDSLTISDSNESVVAIGTNTSFNGYTRSPSRDGLDPAKRLDETFSRLTQQSHDELLAEHTKDYQKLFSACSLVLPGSLANTPTRLLTETKASEPSFAALLFQYGRYLLISSSRTGTEPANLQGLWSTERIPPWSCNYTININAQMNYWPAELTGLAECHEPLLRLTRELETNGTITARKLYGTQRGWTAHHNTSVWRETGPTDGNPEWMVWPHGGGWLCAHLWEHYLFSGDRNYLASQAYPTMKGAAEFYADWLVDDGHGHLISPLSCSPENNFLDQNGIPCALAPGNTMDTEIIKELFSHVIEAGQILNRDPQFINELKSKLARLPAIPIGSHGQIAEWMNDPLERDPLHRHISQLYALYPSDQITQDRTPALFNAARTTLERRGNASTGWSMGWKINFWARLHDGTKAQDVMLGLFKNATPTGANERPGLYPNLFDAHPPFQIDGNFGYTAGVVEMLIQSHRRTEDGVRCIDLLPALPPMWHSGSVKGIRARSGFIVDLDWQDGKLSRAVIHSQLGARCTVFYHEKQVDLTIQPNASKTLDAKDFSTSPS